MFASTSIWVSPFFTGNLGADYLKAYGGGNFVDTFELSPDLVVALEKINNESKTDVFRTLFLPLSNSPYYLETSYQKEGQGGDIIIANTPGGIGDTSNSYSEPIITFMQDSLMDDSFKDQLLLEIANIKYILLRNDVIPVFGSSANSWNFSRVLSNLEKIDGLRLVYEGQHVSLWEYENYRPRIYATKQLVYIPEKYSNLLFSPSSEGISIKIRVITDFENVSELTNWYAIKDFEQNLTLDSSHVISGNFSLKISYNKSYAQGGGNLNYHFEGGENTFTYRWISTWLYYPGVLLQILILICICLTILGMC